MSSPPPRQPSFASLVPEHRRRLMAFALLMASMFMATLDNQIVSTALPTIVGEFGELKRFAWVGSAYLLAVSTVMPVYGKLGDLFGRKYVMMAAIFIFTLGSLVCGLGRLDEPVDRGPGSAGPRRRRHHGIDLLDQCRPVRAARQGALPELFEV